MRLIQGGNRLPGIARAGAGAPRAAPSAPVLPGATDPRTAGNRGEELLLTLQSPG